MPIKIRDAAATLRTIARIRLRDENGVLRNIQRVRMRDEGGILRTVFTGLSVSIPASAGATGTTTSITTPAVATAVTGGTAPYTYQWRAFQNDPVSWNSEGIVINTPNGSSTTFTKNACVSGETYVGTFECVVTDALGASVTSGPCTVSINRT